MLLLSSGAAHPPRLAQGWAHVLHTARAAGQLPGGITESAVIRPDGYVLWVSDDGDLGGVLRQWFGDPR
ncbi:hypothetical protein [Streptomyces rectiviolaceus]|uniref:aromatic-ring hydroxylase C-terminal domain-containing protein n=1 Tax=Streptomyces rectiviolaceus TaxID=332591 RepID=UPI003CD05F43